MDSENDLIRQAKALLGDEPEVIQAVVEDLSCEPAMEQEAQPVPQLSGRQPSHSSEIVSSGDLGVATVYEAPSPPMNATSFQKFGDLPTHIRDGEGINLIEIKKLNLAVAVEALERASTAHENFPSPDAGFAVASLTEQVSKLTRDLEKSHDPANVLDQIVGGALQQLTHEIVQDLAGEMKKLLGETMQMVRLDKQGAYDEAFKTAVNRMGPAMKERLDTAHIRIKKILNIKETAEDREHSRPQGNRSFKR